MKTILVAIATNQVLLSTGIRHSLSRQFDIELLGNDFSKDIFRSIKMLPSPDILLLDTDCPSLQERDIIRWIALDYPATRIILLTTNPDDELIFESIRAGAAACLDKNVTPGKLIRTIRQVFSGKEPIKNIVIYNPDIKEPVRFRTMNDENGKQMADASSSLTSRETEILTYIADGNSNKQIASMLQISEQTAKNHVSNILRKLNANDRAHAAVLATRHGWIPETGISSLTETALNRHL